MANEHRLRANGIYGYLDVNLDVFSTSLVSGALTVAPVVNSTSHLDITLYDETSVIPVFEIVRVISHAASSNTATVIRGIDGVVQNWPPGTRLIHAPVAEDFEPRVLDNIYRRRDGLSHPFDDDFTDEYYSGWTEYHANAQPVTTTEKNGVLSIYSPGNDANAGPSHMWLKEITTLTFPFSIQLAFRAMRRYATNHQMFGPIFVNGLTPTSAAIWQSPYSSTATATAHQFITHSGTVATTGTGMGGTTFEHPGSLLHCRFTAVSTTVWRAEYSPDGISWIAQPVADMNFPMTPTHCGFAMSSWTITSVPQIATVEYFRVTQP